MRSSLVLVLSLALGCSSNPGNNNGNNNNNNNGNDGGNNPNNGSDGGNGNNNGNGLGGNFGTYIVLGDSISDMGGTGPFYYDLLHTDLAAKYPGLMYLHAAQAGAITDAYTNGPLPGAPTLAAQIAGLGHSYPGDVIITITIGGNDLNGHAFDAINGTDGPARMEYAQHLADELGALTTPGRLGSGKVYVVLANIYDFTDGQGDFATVGCGPPANVMATRDVAVFTAWNGVLAEAIGKVNGALYDMHADFMGHGYNFQDVWYDRASCIHPNAAGHDAIRKSMFKLITGAAE
ncbi:MAG TPA: SGNH/GDSL hydrolase family protein [Polyangia bacterium]|nr:SGNH/GDSL hydrolase family protein [Polyangia bacterium]